MKGDAMAKCNIAPKCSLYMKEEDSQISPLEYISQYCNGDYKDCARYKLVQALGTRYVPPGLQPHDSEQVRGIIHSLVE
jgi:hypothetical protein